MIAAGVEAALKKAMEGLGAQDRLVFALRFHDGRTLVDIAKALLLDQKVLYRRVERRVRGAGRGARGRRDRGRSRARDLRQPGRLY